MLRGGLRSQKHDLVNTGKGDIWLIDDCLHLVGRHVDQRPVVADLGNYSLMDDLTTDDADLVREALFGAPTTRGLLVVPEFDLESNRRAGVAGQPASPKFDRVGGNAILRPPRPDVNQVREQLPPGPR